MSTSLSVEQQMIHAAVAVQHLGEGRSMQEIAEERGLSRFAVSRMIRRARGLGLVEVRAALSEPLDIGLSSELARCFGLRSALVVATAGEDDVRDALARMAARFLADGLEEDDVLGISPGRTLVAASRLVGRLPSSDVVQLTGVGTARFEDGVEAVMNLAHAAGGTAFPLSAPILADAASASMLVTHPLLRQTIQRFAHVTKAMLTIGGWPGASLLAQQLEDWGQKADGVVGEIGTTLLADDGSGLNALDGRLIGISEEELRRVPFVVAVGGGSAKARAVRAVLRSGIPDVVITDARCARFALEGSEA